MGGELVDTGLQSPDDIAGGDQVDQVLDLLGDHREALVSLAQN